MLVQVGERLLVEVLTFFWVRRPSLNHYQHHQMIVSEEAINTIITYESRHVMKTQTGLCSLL